MEENLQSSNKSSDFQKATTALLVIDMQNDFVEKDGVLCVDGAKETIPCIQELIKYGRSKNWPIIYVIRQHLPDGSDVDYPRLPLFMNGKKGYCLPGTRGCEIVKGLEPEAQDIIIIKKRNSAFFQTPLDMILRRLGIKNVVISGTQYPNCIRGSAVDAMSYDYNTIVCTDACSAKTKEVAQANIYDMKNMGISCITFFQLKNIL
ncbi:MAG: cysteine hydrolase [Treponema sp.]|nr:cysteine hydrolase [Treponema sp.]